MNETTPKEQQIERLAELREAGRAALDSHELIMELRDVAITYNSLPEFIQYLNERLATLQTVRQELLNELVSIRTELNRSAMNS